MNFQNPPAGDNSSGGDVSLQRTHLALMVSILFLPFAIIINILGISAFPAALMTIILVGAALFSTTKSDVLKDAAARLGRAVSRLGVVDSRSKHVGVEIIGVALFAIIGLAAALTGSDAQDSPGSSDSLSKASVESSLATQYKKQAGESGVTATCPDYIPSRVGATFQCKLTRHSAQALTAVVTVQGTSGDFTFTTF